MMKLCAEENCSILTIPNQNNRQLRQRPYVALSLDTPSTGQNWLIVAALVKAEVSFGFFIGNLRVRQD
jgi:hypothetical protein